MSKSLLRYLAAFAMILTLSTSFASAAPAWNVGDLGRVAWGLLFGSSFTPKLGCEIGPDGSPRCTPTPKLGCEIDPNGKTRCTPAPKLGCTIDPDGSPRCTP